MTAAGEPDDSDGHLSGKPVGGFNLLRQIGVGAMGVVYLARHVRMDWLRALKRPLLPADSTDHTAIAQFIEEARLEGKLEHPNIATVYDYFEADESPWIVMEYFRLGNVRPLVGSLSEQQSVVLLLALLSALAHAHLRGIVHRDVKPENVMRTDDGTAKLADFGIARAEDSLTRLQATELGWFKGDLRYVAPEVVAGKQAQAPADLYAVGLIAHEFLAGGLPFEGVPDAEIPVRKVTMAAVPISELRPDLDRHLAHWVDQHLERDPRRRPDSAAESGARLRADR